MTIRNLVLLQCVVGSLVLTGSMAAGQDPARSAVPLDLSGRRALVEIEVNGKGPFPFVVDSVFESTRLDSGLVKELGLTPDKNGETYTVSLGVGDIRITDDSAVVWDGSDMGMGGDNPRGRLGLSTFSDYLLTLDFPNQELILETGSLSGKDAGKTLDYVELESDDPDDAVLVPAVPMRIAGRDFTVQLNTGTMGELQLHTDLLETLPLTGDPGRVGYVRYGEREAEILGTALDGKLRIGGFEIERPSIFFSELFTTPAAAAEVFDNFAVTFDQANRQIRFVKAEGHELRLFEEATIVQDLTGEDVDLRAVFNADTGKPRMLLILSPT